MLGARVANVAGPQAAHPPVDHVLSPLVDDLLAGALLGTGQDGSHHHGAGPGDQGLGHVPRVPDPSIGNDRNEQSAGKYSGL